MEQNKELSAQLTIEEWKNVQNIVTDIVKGRGYSVTESLWFAHGYTNATGEWKSKFDELKAENERLAEELRESRNSVKSLRYSVDQYYKLITEHTALKAKAQRLVDVLEWYADDGNYFGDNGELATAWKKNMAKKANAALQDWQSKESLGTCKNCNNRAATKDYNGHKHYVCDHCYESLSSEFDEEYR